MMAHFAPLQAAIAVGLLASSTCDAAPKQPAGMKPAGGAFFDDFDRPAPGRWYISDGWTNGAQHNCLWTRNNIRWRKGILQLRLTREPNPVREFRCAEIRTKAALGYGVYEASIRIAEGSGLNSNMFTYSGEPLTKVHDEIDFEMLGKSPSLAQLNYFSRGVGGHEQIIPLGTDGSRAFMHYAFDWRPGSVTYFINGKPVRTVSGTSVPTTPGQFFFSLWGGTPQVRGWLGAFDRSRTPATLEVDWAAFTPQGQSCLFPRSISCSR